MKLTDEFLKSVSESTMPASWLAEAHGVSERTVERWRYEAYKRFGQHPGRGVRPGWTRCPTCHQTVAPG